MQNDGSFPFSKRERASNSFEDFDPETLLQDAFIDDSSDKLDFTGGSNSQSSAMDFEPEPIPHNDRPQEIEIALKQAHKKVIENLQVENHHLYESQALAQFNAALEQMQSSAPASTSYNANIQNNSDMYQDAESFNQRQSSVAQDVFSQISSALKAEHNSQNSAGNQALIDKRGYPIYQGQGLRNQAPRPQLPSQVNTNHGGSSGMQFNDNQGMSDTQLAQANSAPQSFGNTAAFEVNSLQMNASMMQQNSLEKDLGQASIKQDQLPPNTSISVNAQLEHMEKLCESMRRSAVTRNLIKQLSNRSITSQDTSITASSSNIEEDLSSCLSREGSGRNLFKQGAGRQHSKTAPGRGLNRGITVSGRGIGRQGSARSVSSGHSKGDSDSERLTPMLAPGKRRDTPFRCSIGSMDAVLQRMSSPTRSMFMNEVHGVATSQGYTPRSQHVSSTSSAFHQVSTVPGRGIQRHRSNPTLMHRLNQIEDGSMDSYFDGTGETDSV